MTLTAIQIQSGNKKRIVGKVGVTPANDSLPQLKGLCALYKEEFWKDCVSHKLKATGVDYSAWQKAKELGARGMIIYCKDVRKIITVSKDKLDSCRSVDLGGGEGVQIRVPLSLCKVYDGKKQLPFGWTNTIVTIEPKQGWTEEEKQPELF